ncbi:uncharacterized protein BT62DRAFT_721375 [Guyanagaster necrorhizus]|uniref:Uncharacterized protein n=1 Tax=Guyanagaster necrorhizus TaxID=856835 RepID=A0A9P7VY27_9AGAR|nr:uncharacterized protein BT62DRAFT_721375 [Guyanagaster necrorhizus MCA 3950]KAG7448677.1 hypothetical protein BT62DRAFT_721375 [Guyanagaster necrorhizus MCA 3950]
MVRSCPRALGLHVISWTHIGLYTGIVAVTLWNIYICGNGCASKFMKIMVVIILSLYVLATIDFAFVWSIGSSAFTVDGKSFGTVYRTVNGPATATLATGITAIISTILADSTMIWRCWIVWGQRWLVVTFPIFFLLSGIGFKMINVLQRFVYATTYELGVILYSSLILVTTLWCTFLIIYRILTVTINSDGGIGPYRHIIEILVESSLLYSASLILYLGLSAYDSSNSVLVYLDSVVAFARGVAPTLLVGRVAGWARPDDSWQGSVISSTRSSVGDVCELEAQTESTGIGNEPRDTAVGSE